MTAEVSTRRMTVLSNHFPSVDIQCNRSSGSIHTAQQVLDTRRNIEVLDSYMSYLDTEVGDNVVIFLHGNPTAAYLWRNVMPHVQPVARCLAPDLIGMGHSDKPDIEYKFEDHYKFLSAWIEKMAFPGKISIVCHDWGSALGFHWSQQHMDRVRAIVHMEMGVLPDWELFPESFRGMFQALRSDAGEEMNLKQNHFIEHYLPKNIIRKLTHAEMEEYRLPYKHSEKARLPTLAWPREIAVATEGPENVIDIVNAYRPLLAKDVTIPKLYIDAQPGLLSPAIRNVIQGLPNHKFATVKGLHFLQEDSPNEIGQAIKTFLVDVYKSN